MLQIRSSSVAVIQVTVMSQPNIQRLNFHQRPANQSEARVSWKTGVKSNIQHYIRGFKLQDSEQQGSQNHLWLWLWSFLSRAGEDRGRASSWGSSLWSQPRSAGVSRLERLRPSTSCRPGFRPARSGWAPLGWRTGGKTLKGHRPK